MSTAARLWREPDEHEIANALAPYFEEGWTAHDGAKAIMSLLRNHEHDAIARAAAPRHDYNEAILQMCARGSKDAQEIIGAAYALYYAHSNLSCTERRIHIGKIRSALDELNRFATALEAAECASLGHSVAA